MLARDALGEWPKAGGTMAGLDFDDDGDGDDGDDRHSYTSDGRLLTNIVMMGMGEPLYNFDARARCAEAGDGRRWTGTIETPDHAIDQRRGANDGRLPGAEIGVNLAVSLHAVTKEVRDEIVPINRKYGIEELLAGLRRLSRRIERASHHVRICDAEGQERQRRRCARTDPPAQAVQAARQSEPDPVQPLARRDL
jgi:hypothetical protein